MAEKLPVLPAAIEGPRLFLRRWQTGDAAQLSLAVERNLEHLRPWMPWVAEEPLDIAERVRLIASWEQDWLAGGDVVFGVFADDQILGGCGLHRRRGPTGLEIGYWVDKDHLRQGIGVEIARLLTTAALAVDGVTFVEIHHDKANIASAGIARRLGYRYLGETADNVSAPAEVGIDCGWRMHSASWARRSVAP